MAHTAQIAVIGGGASGMLAAITAAQTLQRQKKPGRVVLLEKENRIGKKLLATGNGRCNLSNLAAAPAHYHGAADWAAPLLTRFPAKAVIRQFETMGLLCRSDSEGRVYPYNSQAAAVLEILRLQLALYQVEVVCGFPAARLERRREGFAVTDRNGEQWLARRVILSAGGRAAPKLGTDGSGTALARQMGHTVTPELPALVQVTSEPSRVKNLKGMRSQARVTLLEDGTPTLTEDGEVQFTAQGLSGICVFQLSGRINQLLAQGVPVELELDLMPDWQMEPLTKQIAAQSKRYGNLPPIELLCGCVNQRVGQAVVKAALGGALPKRAGACGYDRCGRIAETVKHFRFPITGSMGWESAQVTAGGVCGAEIDNRTMESKRCGGLYLTGELIDLYGDCGGFNLHWAWSTGIAAGQACANALGEEKNR